MSTKKKSLIIFIRNWMGGSSFIRLMEELCEGEYIVAAPERVAWRKGNMDFKSSNLTIVPFTIEAAKIYPFSPINVVYIFRKYEVLKYFLDINNINLNDHNILIQTRNPADLLIAEYFGNTISHGSALGHEKKWNRMRMDLLTKGIDKYVLEQSHAIEFEYNSLLNRVKASGGIPIYLSYKNMVVDFEKYLKKLIGYLQLNINDNEISDLINKHDAYAYLKDSLNHNKIDNNLKRMKKRPEEWPFPGRAKLVLKKEIYNQVISNSKTLYSINSRINTKKFNYPEPPKQSIINSKVILWCKFIWRMKIKEALRHNLKKFKN